MPSVPTWIGLNGWQRDVGRGRSHAGLVRPKAHQPTRCLWRTGRSMWRRPVRRTSVGNTGGSQAETLVTQSARVVDRRHSSSRTHEERITPVTYSHEQSPPSPTSRLGQRQRRIFTRQEVRSKPVACGSEYSQVGHLAARQPPVNCPAVFLSAQLWAKADPVLGVYAKSRCRSGQEGQGRQRIWRHQR